MTIKFPVSRWWQPVDPCVDHGWCLSLTCIGITSVSPSRNFRRFRDATTDSELRVRGHYTEFCETFCENSYVINFMWNFYPDTGQYWQYILCMRNVLLSLRSTEFLYICVYIHTLIKKKNRIELLSSETRVTVNIHPPAKRLADHG